MCGSYDSHLTYGEFLPGSRGAHKYLFLLYLLSHFSDWPQNGTALALYRVDRQQRLLKLSCRDGIVNTFTAISGTFTHAL
jgi:hypothetical protein